jgi:hypothetical protein
MTNLVQTALERVRAFNLRALQRAQAAHHRLGTRGVVAVVVIAAALLLVGGAWLSRDGEPQSAARLASGDGWRFLVVCRDCGHRERTSDSPSRQFERRGGLLRCPACESFGASWYRRGGLSLPPGGW